MKKLLNLCLVLLMSALSIVGLSACGNTACDHSYKSVVTDPTCTENGFTTHVCENCGDSYVDSYTRPSHTYGTLIAEVPATCETAGTKAHYHCSACNKNFDANYVEIPDSNLTIAATGHNYGTLIAEVPATCETAGTKAHYHCSACNKNFDASHIEISDADLAIAATGHSYGTLIAEVSATCETNGAVEHYHCSGCGKDFDSNKNELYNITIAATGHNYGTLIAEVPATCETSGEVEHYHCSGCNKDFTANKVEIDDLTIAATGHSYGDWLDAVSATCTAEGSIAHYHCSVCEKNFDADKNEIANIATSIVAHTYGDWIDSVSPDCETAGNVGYYHCSVCEKNFDTDKNELESITIDATGHDYVNGYCTVCNVRRFTQGLILRYDGSSELRGYSVVGYEGTMHDTEIIIPIEDEDSGSKVIMIGFGAFKNNTKIKRVIITENVQQIKANAFYGCSNLESVIMGASVSDINNYAFYNCSKLTEINLPDKLSYIGDYAFAGCTGLTGSIIFAESSTVQYINKGAFENVPMVNIILPASLKSINNNAFNGCNNLTDVYYRGTAEQWKQVSILSTGNDAIKSATVHYYSETQPTESGSYWHYNESGEIEIWAPIVNTSVVDNKTFNYSSSTVDLSDTYWSMLEAAKSNNDRLNELFDNDSTQIEMVKSSSTKEEYAGKLATWYASQGAYTSVSFAEWKITLTTSTGSAQVDYTENNNKIYNMANKLLFTYDSNTIYEELSTEYYTVRHTYTVAEA